MRHPSADLRLVNSRNGHTLARQLVPAFDSASRRKGLLGRLGLGDGEALFIAPSNAVHTFFMRFSIDILFLRRDGTVVGMRHNVGPWRIAVSPRAHLVVELQPGSIRDADTKKGDVLRIDSATEATGERDPA